MPHFDEFGGDTWLCQKCCLVFDSTHKSTWVEGVGNLCGDCEWKRQHDLKCPSTLHHRDIASKHGVQMTQHGMTVTAFHLWCARAAEECFKEMVSRHWETHEHSLHGSCVSVRRALCTKSCRP